MIFKGETN